MPYYHEKPKNGILGTKTRFNNSCSKESKNVVYKFEERFPQKAPRA
jgi:hypothetical protein